MGGSREIRGTVILVVLLCSFLLGPINALRLVPTMAVKGSNSRSRRTGSSSSRIGDRSSMSAPPANPTGDDIATPLRWSNHWYPVAVVRDAVELQPLSFHGKEIVLWQGSKKKDGETRFYAAEDRCLHREARLSTGSVTADGQIRCGYHGWRYSGEGGGECTFCPQRAGLSCAKTSRLKLRTYQTKVEGGLVWLWPDPDTRAPAPSPQELSGADVDADGDSDGWTCHDVPYNIRLVLENTLDLSHFMETHLGPLGGDDIIFETFGVDPEKMAIDSSVKLGPFHYQFRVMDSALVIEMKFTFPTFVTLTFSSSCGRSASVEGHIIALDEDHTRLIGRNTGMVSTGSATGGLPSWLSEHLNSLAEAANGHFNNKAFHASPGRLDPFSADGPTPTTASHEEQPKQGVLLDGGLMGKALADALFVMSDIGRFVDHQIGILVNLQDERQIYGQRLNDARHYKVLAADIDAPVIAARNLFNGKGPEGSRLEPCPWEGKKAMGLSNDPYDVWESHTKNCATCRRVRGYLKDFQNVCGGLSLSCLVVEPLYQATLGDPSQAADVNLVAVFGLCLIPLAQQLIDNTESLHHIARK